MIFIKICGVTDVQTASDAAALGANYIGLVFAKQSPRTITMDVAKDIIASKGNAKIVGVFAEQEKDEILAIVAELDLDLVQLHGDNARSAYGFLPLPCIYALSYGNPIPETFNASRDFLLFDNPSPGSGSEADRSSFVPPACRYFLAGGVTPENVSVLIERFKPFCVDVSSGVETLPGCKDMEKISRLLKKDRYGIYGGCYVPEILVQPLQNLRREYEEIVLSSSFQEELKSILCNYAGRPTPITEVSNFAKAIGSKARIFLKREDLLHTGAHKLNNAIGQCLLAKRCGKTRIIAETGAGQHGVATATACALLGLECVVFMGEIDMERQAPNVVKMRLLGAEVVPVPDGTLKDAVNEALRDWAESYETTHYCLGSALGPHPFPAMVAQFQSVIGIEAREQFQLVTDQDPDLVVACVGGGSNAIGLFSAYLELPQVDLIGVEAAGAARFSNGSPGVLHGTYSYVLQNEEGQIAKTQSISAGLDYPGVGPQHAALFQSGRVRYSVANDEEALAAFRLLCRTEGIIPALESSHALAYVARIACDLSSDAYVLVNLSGRGDKDLGGLDGQI